MSGNGPDTNETNPVIRTTDDDARRLAKGLIRSARFGALAVHDVKTGHPLASRVAMATDLDGTPVILTSTLSAHTAAILADPACSLLVGEPGKGDPLAHPRISLFCKAVKVGRDGDDNTRLRRRYLARHPKAELYADFADFSFFRLELTGGSLNGGFGKAYELTVPDLTTSVPDLTGWSAVDDGAVAHMNEDHADAVKLYAQQLCKAENAKWRLACLDPEGMDLVAGDHVARLWFETALENPDQVRSELVALAQKARSKV